MRIGLLRELGHVPWNERILYSDVGIQAIIEAGAISFLSVFLVRLGASNWLVGLYQALPALVMTVVSLPMGAFVQRQRSLVAVSNWGRFLFRLGLGSFVFLPFLPKDLAAYVLVGVYSLLFIPGSASNVAFTTILGQVAPADRRPRMLSMRLAINGLCAAGVGLLAGQWLSGTTYPFNYQMLFLSAFLAGMAIIFVLGQLRLPQNPVESTARKSPGAGATAHRSGSWRGMWSLMAERDVFRNYCLAALLFRLSMAMPQALYTIYRVRVMGASDWWIGVLLTTERVLSVLVYLALGRLLSRSRVRRWLWVTCIGVALYPLTMGLARTPEMLLIPAICGGIFGSGMNIFITNTLFQVSPEDGRPPFVAADATLANITSFVGPILGTALASAMGIAPALLVIAGFRVLGGLSFWRLKVGRET